MALKIRLRLRRCRGLRKPSCYPQSQVGNWGWHAAYTETATTQDNGQIKSKIILFTYFHITVTLRLKTISLTNKGWLDSHSIWSPFKTSQDFFIFPRFKHKHPTPRHMLGLLSAQGYTGKSTHTPYL